MALRFLKMHGLGNDFVIVDGRSPAHHVSPDLIRALSDRHTGIGCDQFIEILPARAGGTAFMRIRNPDGSESGACGNATRCVAHLLMAEAKQDRVAIETLNGTLPCERRGGNIAVDMGPACLAWNEIPLAREMETAMVPIGAGPLSDPVATGMGNPHATFFVNDLDAIDMTRWGPVLEHDPLFPERANIGVAQITGPDRLRLRVWERGAGLTLACGSGACAAGVAAVRRGLTGRRVTVEVERGAMEIEWREADGRVIMAGPVAHAFAGEVHPSLTEAVATEGSR